MVVWLHGRRTERGEDKEDKEDGRDGAEGKEMEKETRRREKIQPQLPSSGPTNHSKTLTANFNDFCLKTILLC